MTDYYTVGQARAALGLSRDKIAEFIRSGLLSYEQAMYDRRVKLIRAEAVKALASNPAMHRPTHPSS